MKELLERIQAGEILVADGAMGTMLMERAAIKKGEPPEAINLTHPDVLIEIASLYHAAGAELIQTNTFGGSSLKLDQYGMSQAVVSINKAAVTAVREAVGTQAYISASIGPTGRIVKPYGDTEPELIFESYAQQIAAVVESGCDVLCIETMIDLTEAVQAIKAARSISSTIPVMATMTFDKTRRGFFTIMGVSVEKAVKGLTDAGADIIGSNCGNGIENMILIAQEFRKQTSTPLLFQANAGLPKIENEQLLYPETPEFYAEKAAEFVRLGVSIIGGCCGTTPEHIKAIRMMIDRISR